MSSNTDTPSRKSHKLILECDLTSDGLVESPYEYQNKRFLPVEPGQEIGPKKPKYQIIAKIGHGSSCTVWLVRPARLRSDERGRWHALKIMAANSGNPSREVKSVQAVRKCGVDVAGCLDTKDTWQEVRGNNKYLCMLMPLSGPSVDNVVFCKPTLEQRLLLAFHVTEAMMKLHGGNIFINDFTGSNILIKVRKDLEEFTGDEMMEIIENVPADVKQQIVDTDGRSRWVTPVEPIPKALYGKVSLIPLIDEKFPLELIDVHQDSLKYPITLLYASPESINKNAPDSQSNIWALGVLLCRILTGYYPFEDSTFDGIARCHKEFFAMTKDQQRQKFDSYAACASDSVGQYIFDTYRQGSLTDLLMSIFHRKANLKSIEKMLKKIKHGAPKRSDSILEDDLSSMEISSTESKKARDRSSGTPQPKTSSKNTKPSSKSTENISASEQPGSPTTSRKHRPAAEPPRSKTAITATSAQPEPRPGRSGTAGKKEEKRRHSGSRRKKTG